jgi:hypothetical protein
LFQFILEKTNFNSFIFCQFALKDHMLDGRASSNSPAFLACMLQMPITFFPLVPTPQSAIVIIQLITNARFLGIWLNNKLFWKNHLIKVKGKMAIQMLAFSKLAAFAWGTSVFSARQVYAVIIRNVLTYAAPSWHDMGDGLKKLSKTLTLI